MIWPGSMLLRVYADETDALRGFEDNLLVGGRGQLRGLFEI